MIKLFQYILGVVFLFLIIGGCGTETLVYNPDQKEQLGHKNSSDKQEKSDGQLGDNNNSSNGHSRKEIGFDISSTGEPFEALQEDLMKIVAGKNGSYHCSPKKRQIY